MARLTNRQKQEIFSTCYGINPKTLQVDSVSVTKDGRLFRHGIGVPYHIHLIPKGATAQSEIAIVYELEDVIEIPMLLWNNDHHKTRVDELRARAAAMRAERDTGKI